MAAVTTLIGAQVLVGCACPCKIRHYPSDPLLSVLAHGQSRRAAWWVLIECQACGSKIAFGETISPAIAVRMNGERFFIRTAQVIRKTCVRPAQPSIADTFNIDLLPPVPTVPASNDEREGKGSQPKAQAAQPATTHDIIVFQGQIFCQPRVQVALPGSARARVKKKGRQPKVHAVQPVLAPAEKAACKDCEGLGYVKCKFCQGKGRFGWAMGLRCVKCRAKGKMRCVTCRN